MTDKTRKIGTAILALVNLGVAFYAGFAYIAFTANMAIESGASRELTTMRGGGATGGLSRYVAISVIALLLHAFLAIFNLSVTAHLINDAWRRNIFCGALFFAASFCTIATAALLSFLQM